MNVFEFVVALTLIAMIGSVIKARYGIRQDKHGNDIVDDPAAKAENARLRDEVRALRDRVQVLERVVTDTEGSLSLDREIERLRDRNNA
jgi:hypothetical protein